MKLDRLLMAYQNSRWLLVGLLTVAVLGVGCTKALMYDYRFNPTDLAPEDALTVTQVHSGEQEYSDKLEKKVVGCIKDTVEDTHPTVRVVSPEEFRRVAFPDLTRADILAGDWWEQLTKDPAFATRIAPLDLRYLIIVSGETTTDSKLRVEIVCGYGCGPAWEATFDKQSNLRAMIIDLKQGHKAGTVQAFASGETAWLFPPSPLVFPTFPESRACGDLGEGVAKFLAGEKLPEEEGIWPAMREEDWATPAPAPDCTSASHPACW